MPDTDFFRLDDASVSGRKDLVLASALDYETDTQHAVMVQATLAPTSTAAGAQIHFFDRLGVSNVAELPALVSAPADVRLAVPSTLAVQSHLVDYAETFIDPEGQFWWLTYDEALAPPASQLVIAQGTGLQAKQITYSTPAYTANPASGHWQIHLRAEQPLGTIVATTIQHVYIDRYAPAALFASPRIIPLIGATASGTGSTHALTSFYQNSDSRPVSAYFDVGGQQHSSIRGAHWTYSIGSDGSLPTLVMSRDDNPNGPHWTDERGEIVAVHIATTDAGDTSSVILRFSVAWY